MNKDTIILSILCFILWIISLFWFVQINRNQEEIRVNNKQISDLNRNLKDIVKDKDKIMKQIETNNANLVSYKTSKQTLAVMEVKIFLEYIIYGNNNSNQIAINLENNNIQYIDDNVDNVFKTMNELEKMQEQGFVSNIKYSKIEYKDKMFYKTSFDFTLWKVREFLLSKQDVTIDKYWKYLEISTNETSWTWTNTSSWIVK